MKNMENKIEFHTQVNPTQDSWVMRITADRRIEVNEDVEVTEAAKKVLEAMQHLLAQPEQEPVEPDNDKVICPHCCTLFRAIPVNVQQLLLDAGFEPPFVAAPQERKPPTA